MNNNENIAWERAHRERVSAGNGYDAACERGGACESDATCESVVVGEKDAACERGGAGEKDAACAAENDSVLDAGRFITCAAQLSYNGAPFHGFARQPHQCSVQGNVEAALATLFRIPVQTVCAGRTDAGVHARRQVISFDMPTSFEERIRSPRSLFALNALTHDAIAIHDIKVVEQGFSARFDAIERTYRYLIYNAVAPCVLIAPLCWHITKPLDVSAMQQAAQFFIGEHDYKSFCHAPSAVGKPTCRFVRCVNIIPVEVWGYACIAIEVVGNAFLHSMVRTMVGTLVHVGLGKRQPQWIEQVLHTRDRRAAGPCAPACGLTFWDVSYPSVTFEREQQQFSAAWGARL